MSLLYTHAYHAPDVFEMVLQCQNLRSLHLDLSPLYFPFEGRVTTIPSALGLDHLEPTPRFHLAEDFSIRVTPRILENGLEDFATRYSFYKSMKQVQNMKSLREFKLIGRASNEEQVRVPRPPGRPAAFRALGTPAPVPTSVEVGAAGLGYNYHTGLLPPNLKTEIFLPLNYGKASPQSQESEALSGKDAQ
jgi:hypothetical protein